LWARLLAAAKIDDDLKKNLVPVDLKNIGQLSKDFGSFILSEKDCSKMYGYDLVDLPPFLKNTLIKTMLLNMKNS